MRQGDVVDERPQHQQPLALAIFGQHHDPPADGRARRACVEWFSVDLDDAGGTSIGAEDRTGDL